jgi:hypothetical protein
MRLASNLAAGSAKCRLRVNSASMGDDDKRSSSVPNREKVGVECFLYLSGRGGCQSALLDRQLLSGYRSESVGSGSRLSGSLNAPGLY